MLCIQLADFGAKAAWVFILCSFKCPFVGTIMLFTKYNVGSPMEKDIAYQTIFVYLLIMDEGGG